MKKALISLLLVLVLLSQVIMPVLASTTYYVKTPNGGPLIYREGPGKDFKKAGRLKYGSAVQVRDYEGNWAHIEVGNGIYFVWAAYLSATKPKGNGSSSSGSSDSYSSFVAADYEITINPTRATGFVNMRWAPDQNARVQAKYYSGDHLHVIAEGKNWLQVIDLDSLACGFIMKNYTEKLETAGNTDSL